MTMFAEYRAQLFAKWGGLDKAKDCFPDLTDVHNRFAK